MRLSTEKAIEFVENLEKYHPIQKYWDESNERHRQEKNTENYPYSYFRGVLIRKIAEIIEALQQENEQLKADLRGKDNEINDLKALIEYLRKFKPKKNETVREAYEVDG